MTFQIFLFLLVFFLILSLALLWRLCWLHFQPSHSQGGSQDAPRCTVCSSHAPRSIVPSAALPPQAGDPPLRQFAPGAR